MLVFGKHLFSATFFFSNIKYFFESGYFDKTSELKPLLHIWSLSLEEQFYFVWPMFLVIVYKLQKLFNKSVFEIALLIVCVISFIACVLMTSENEPLAFFNLPFRLWELGLGGALSIWLQSASSRFKNRLQKSSFFISLLGLGLLAYSFYYFSRTTKFPSYNALIPVFGTILLLLNLQMKNVVNTVLKNPVLVYIGKVSYPFYLWHWPLYSFSYLLLGDLSPIVATTLIFTSFMLSVLTYEFVEKKISYTNLAIFSLLASNLLLGLVGYFFADLANTLPSSFKRIDHLLETKKAFTASLLSERNSKFCNHHFKSLEMCLLSNELKEPTVVLIGDSHANQWYPAFEKFLKKTYPDQNLLVLAKNGTAPILGLQSLRNPSTDLEAELKFVLNNKKINAVILSGFWSNYVSENGTLVSGYYYKNKISSSHTELKSQKEIFIYHLRDTLQALRKEGKIIYFIHDTPALTFNFEICLPRPFQVRTQKNRCLYDSEEERRKQSEYRAVVSSILETFQVQTLDPLPYICAEKYCTLRSGDVYLFSDSHHLSIQGSQLLLDRLEPRF